jgi:hypothetical protein
MRLWWLLGSLLCFFGAGILIVRPTWPAWRVHRPSANPAGISDDGRRLLTISSPGEKPKTCRVIDTHTTDVVESWELEDAPNSLYYSKERGFGSIRTEIVAMETVKDSHESHKLRVIDTKNRKDLYVGLLKLVVKTPRVIGTRVLGNILALNLDVAPAPPREFFLRDRMLVLIDLTTQSHRCVEQAYLVSVSTDYKYFLMLEESGSTFVADAVTFQEVLRIPGESIGMLEPVEDGYRVQTRTFAAGQSDEQHYSRYFWKPGGEPRLIEKSTPFSSFGTLPMMGPFVDARSNAIYFRQSKQQEWPDFIQKAMHWIGMDDYYEHWHQYDFVTGKRVRTWSVNGLTNNTLVAFHLPTSRAYFKDNNGYLVAWDLPPRSLAPWGYACLGASVVCLFFFIMHRRIFARSTTASRLPESAEHSMTP